MSVLLDKCIASWPNFLITLPGLYSRQTSTQRMCDGARAQPTQPCQEVLHQDGQEPLLQEEIQR